VLTRRGCTVCRALQK